MTAFRRIGARWARRARRDGGVLVLMGATLPTAIAEAVTRPGLGGTIGAAAWLLLGGFLGIVGSRQRCAVCRRVLRHDQAIVTDETDHSAHLVCPTVTEPIP